MGIHWAKGKFKLDKAKLKVQSHGNVKIFKYLDRFHGIILKARIQCSLWIAVFHTSLVHISRNQWPGKYIYYFLTGENL